MIVKYCLCRYAAQKEENSRTMICFYSLNVSNRTAKNYEVNNSYLIYNFLKVHFHILYY